MLCLLSTKALIPLRCFGRQRRDLAVGRIDEQRCSSALDDVRASLKPEVVVSAPREVGRPALTINPIDVILLNSLSLVSHCFLFGEKLLVAQLGWSLEGRQCGVGPDALKVRLSVGCS